MGGSFSRGNTTPAAEFNMYVDPEAASAVFNAGWPVTMIGLDVTHLADATPEVLERIEALRTELGSAVAGMLRFYRDQKLRQYGTAAPHVHDPCAVARVAQPELITCLDAEIDVELAGTFTRGMTVTEFRRRHRGHAKALVGTDLDIEGFWDLFIDALGRLGARRD
jgi:purine nucleosidase